MNFNEANKQVHPVETQWHYKTMIKAGFTTADREAVSFVRSYRYTKEDLDITVTTGCNADYWVDNITGDRGYGGTLASYVAIIE